MKSGIYLLNLGFPGPVADFSATPKAYPSRFPPDNRQNASETSWDTTLFVGASLLAINVRTPRGIWITALSFTTIAGKPVSLLQ